MAATLTGLRYRLLPHPGQERILGRSVGACRWLWNWALDYRENIWLAVRGSGAKGVMGSVGYVHLSSLLPGLKQEYPWLAEAPHHALQATLRDFDRAFAAFFAGRAGFPQFHHKGDRDSMRFPDPKQVKVVEDWVKLPKLGWVHFRRSRPLGGEVRNVTVSREGDAWYISFCVRGEFVLPNAGRAPIGIDLGISQSVTTSLGEVISFPVPAEKEERRLRLLQRRASRRQKGSRGRRLACRAVAKVRRHWARRRRDAAHKASTRFATTHVLVALEDLPIQRMTASARGSKENPGRNVEAKAKVNRGMLANAHADFRRMLAYKCARSGARLVIVDPAYTSQTCQACRHVSPENRKSQAVFLCTACGFATNADWNAAVNVLAAGQAVTAQGGLGVTPAFELRTHPRDRKPSRSGSTGIPAKAAPAA